MEIWNFVGKKNFKINKLGNAFLRISERANLIFLIISNSPKTNFLQKKKKRMYSLSCSFKLTLKDSSSCLMRGTNLR